MRSSALIFGREICDFANATGKVILIVKDGRMIQSAA